MIIGLTGGIATGKSSVCKILKELDYIVIDSDQIVHQEVNHNPMYLQALEATFTGVVKENKIDSKKLGQRIFHDSIAREKLNDLAHPYVVASIQDKIKQHNNEQLIFLDIPLLFEANLTYLCDCVVVVYTTTHNQCIRLMERDSITKEYAQAKIQSQMSIEEKKEKADFIIDNTKELKTLKKQILEMIEGVKQWNV